MLKEVFQNFTQGRLVPVKGVLTHLWPGLGSEAPEAALPWPRIWAGSYTPCEPTRRPTQWLVESCKPHVSNARSSTSVVVFISTIRDMNRAPLKTKQHHGPTD